MQQNRTRLAVLLAVAVATTVAALAILSYARGQQTRQSVSTAVPVRWHPASAQATVEDGTIMPRPWTADVATLQGRLLQVLEAHGPTPALIEYAALHRREREALLSGQDGARVLVFYCDAGLACGGNGNRLQGVQDALVLAMLSRRAFFIAWTRQGRLEDSLVPGPWIDWTLPLDALQRLKAPACAAQTFHIDLIDGPFKDNPWKQRLFRDDIVAQLAPHNIVAVRFNIMWMAELLQNPHVQTRAAELGLLGPCANGTLSQQLLTLLFRPAPPVAQAIQQFDAYVRERVLRVDRLDNVTLIGLQVRTGGDGAWDDPKRLPISMVTRYSQEAIAFAHNASSGLPIFGTVYPPQPLVFITSDSYKAISSMQEHLAQAGVRSVIVPDEIAGPITHSERSKQPQQLRVWVDFFMVATSDLLVHGRSSLGESAVSLACRPSVYFRNLHSFIGGDMSMPPFIFPHGYCDYWAHTNGHVKPLD